MKRAIQCKHFNGIFHKKCYAGIIYDDLDRDCRMPGRKALPCIISFDDSNPKRVKCELSEYPTQEELEARERKVKESIRKIGIARKSITEHMQGKSGGGDIQCPVCGTGKLLFIVSEVNGHIHAKCTTSGCVAWME